MNAWNRPDLLADVRKLEFLPESYYDELLAQDVLEHLPRTDTLPTLVHWNRLLRMGGRITIRVPSILGLADLLRHPQYQHPSKQEELMKCLFGTQAYTGDFHFTSFTQVLLEHYLEQSGFRPLRLDVLHSWLFDCDAEKVRHIGKPLSRDFKELLPIADDGEFVRTCYREIFRREPDVGGQEFFLSGLRVGGLTREAMIASMLSSDEYRALPPG
jgi:predicted SAM-dependent methyltransferase